MGDKQNVRVDTGFGIVWFIGWLFTIGYLKLQFWTGVLAMIIWPYYLGASFRKEDGGASQWRRTKRRSCGRRPRRRAPKRFATAR